MEMIEEPNDELTELGRERKIEEAYHLLQDELIPLATDMVDHVRSVQLQTEEVIELHNYLIEYVDLFLENYEELEALKEEGVFSVEIDHKMDEIDRKGDRMIELTNIFDEELGKLMKQHNVEWIDEE